VRALHGVDKFREFGIGRHPATVAGAAQATRARSGDGVKAPRTAPPSEK
jgi:hypothetical protein